METHRHPALPGFTLVELAIVLIIIALIIAGITKGQNLLGASRITSLVSELQNHRLAVQSFKMKYDAYPGDFAQAAARWPSGSTSSGNQDGIIAAATEGYAAWQHLALSGILPNSTYSGTAGSGLVAGTNVPGSGMIEGAVYQFQGNYSLFAANLGNVLLIGMPNGSNANKGILTAKEMENLDFTLDDGKPDSGIVRGASGLENASAACTTNLWNDPAPATYQRGDKTGKCFVVSPLAD